MIQRNNSIDFVAIHEIWPDNNKQHNYILQTYTSEYIICKVHFPIYPLLFSTTLCTLNSVLYCTVLVYVFAETKYEIMMKRNKATFVLQNLVDYCSVQWTPLHTHIFMDIYR